MTDEAFDSVNCLGSMFSVAGNDIQLVFNVVDGSTGLPLNISAATCFMKICPYGQEDMLILTKAGIITSGVGGVFKVNLNYSDIKDLNGVYTAQPGISVTDGSPPTTRYFYPGNLVLNFSALIQ